MPWERAEIVWHKMADMAWRNGMIGMGCAGIRCGKMWHDVARVHRIPLFSTSVATCKGTPGKGLTSNDQVLRDGMGQPNLG